ncbi:uncharacterized protein LOC141609464 [Silene latifolia]|uniref:uncharacterized protein LOC141609464 n=1 Tax=Silene latifolia TaxID=37657 RepID=UPI003D7713A1
MTGLSRCNALKISLIDYYDESLSDVIKFDEEELRDVNPGPPRNISTLKLILCEGILSRSSISAFLNGLFWTCHPRIISFQIRLNDPNLMIEHLKSELENMANCQSHPLKRVEGPNCSNLRNSTIVNVQMRLHWRTGGVLISKQDITAS